MPGHSPGYLDPMAAGTRPGCIGGGTASHRESIHTAGAHVRHRTDTQALPCQPSSMGGPGAPPCWQADESLASARNCAREPC